MTKKHFLLLLLILFCLPVLAQQHPVRERGFRPEYVYDPNGFDTINVTTGNLIGTIPLGVTYPVGEGLSYGFTLYYTGNVWQDYEDCNLYDPYAPCKTRYSKRAGDNAGFGWRVSFGRLHEGVVGDPGEYNAAAAKWRYEVLTGVSTSSGKRPMSRSVSVGRRAIAIRWSPVFCTHGTIHTCA